MTRGKKIIFVMTSWKNNYSHNDKLGEICTRNDKFGGKFLSNEKKGLTCELERTKDWSSL
jgi:hypothetical protein